MSRLVRDEIRLAQKEFQQSAKHAGIGAGLFAFIGAGIAALIGRKQADEVTPAAPRTVETVKADIERTRNELGETVQALSGKLDVKERGERSGLSQSRHAEACGDGQSKANRPIAAVGVIAAAALAIVMWRRR
jgi:hypothetical protein